MSRAILLVLDSLGVGSAPDAARFGDVGANTLGHIADWCVKVRGRNLHLPQLFGLGLAHAAQLASGEPLSGAPANIQPPIARWGCAFERSTGKDTVSGHWELCGLPVDFDWTYFEAPEQTFPPELLSALAQAAGTEGVLGNCHASGTEIIARLGAEHLRRGWPIVYTSADSVLQIAAHEDVFGLQRLYQLCAAARELLDRHNLRVGRVIARPFIGSVGEFRRTSNRHDYATPPTAATLLDGICAQGGQVLGVGKIGDIFAMRGISRNLKAHGLDALMQTTRSALRECPDNSLVFTNLVDFDQEFGHRRDVAGYADALERFDAMLPALLADLGPRDLLIMVADHGNDPTWRGSDHTREQIPILAYAAGLAPGSIGRRDSFADVGQSLASWLHLPPLAHGESFL